jgi:hypothetical protein
MYMESPTLIKTTTVHGMRIDQYENYTDYCIPDQNGSTIAVFTFVNISQKVNLFTNLNKKRIPIMQYAGPVYI